MYRKRAFRIRPEDDEQKPISLFHNPYNNQRVAEVRTQETDSGVNVGFRSLPRCHHGRIRAALAAEHGRTIGSMSRRHSLIDFSVQRKG